MFLTMFRFFQVNFTDDVGQTLLNWAAAFGTAEMVDYLCEKGTLRICFVDS